MKEFLGINGYSRSAEGFLSWQHLLFVGSLLTLMVIASVLIGKRNRLLSSEKQNLPLIISAVLINAVEIFKIIILCIRGNGAIEILYNLPLFLCSIQLIAIPLAAFTKGKLREAALDFVAIFGILGAVFGTIGAGQNYAVYPVLSLDNVASGITHSISGFASLYIMISKMASLKRKNIGLTFSILGVFCAAAYIANVILDYNYMFLMAGDGTPYDIAYNLVGGSPVLYPLCVVALFVLYIGLFYYCISLFEKKKRKKTAQNEIQEPQKAEMNI
jgi:uncharacterized membrane protein YwaF